MPIVSISSRMADSWAQIGHTFGTTRAAVQIRDAVCTACEFSLSLAAKGLLRKVRAAEEGLEAGVGAHPYI